MLKLQVRDQLMMRNKIRQILWLLCCLPVLTGCIGEDDYANDPRGNFEQLWKIIDEQYCFLDTKGIDWDAVHDEYSKLIIPSMSNDDLFDILSQMLYILKDGHVPVVFLITMHGIRATPGIIEKIFFITIIWVVPIQAIAHPLVLNIKYSTIT